MADIQTLENNIKKIIDDLKGICNTNGLSNSAAEETVITSVFLYKFLNDRFMWNLDKFSKEYNRSVDDILENKDDLLDAFYDTYTNEAAFTAEDTIKHLGKLYNLPEFDKAFDNTLKHISDNPKNEIYSVETAQGEKLPLFTGVCSLVEEKSRNDFAKSIYEAISSKKFDFGEAFEENFDFYSTIFEYLIKDYNVASGTYAEYFTPQAISSIIAKILVRMSPTNKELYEVYDPSAGSGSLVLHLAHELGEGTFGSKARVYTQDISQKSSRLLRLNMLLNGLTDSLHNIVKGDTILNPAHFVNAGNANSGLKKFDYITSNPPFKLDFSSTRDSVVNKWGSSDRFFAGVPTIPNKKKESMAIYLLFIQHILYSLKEDGKAAIVVPTGFITAQSGIEKKIRERIIDRKWLKGVISMPSNIFANTGTNVSILFIDKANNQDNSDVILIDASKLGTKVKDGKNQKTVLSKEETKKIEDTFINKEVIDDFSVIVTYDQIKEKNYSFSAGQYFDVKIEYVELTQDEFNAKMNEYQTELQGYFEESNKLQQEIMEQLKKVKYE
jgi:type I restriction enzyme M protein